MPYSYKFKLNDNGECIKTAKGQINLHNIERILGKAKVKGSKKDYEFIEIKNCLNHSDDGIYICERKHLTVKIVISFIICYYNGDRSIQNHPYEKDLLDKELLDDLGIVVLTYKHYYSSSDRLVDSYYPTLKSKVTEELLQRLEEWSKDAERKATNARNRAKEEVTKTKWIPV